MGRTPSSRTVQRLSTVSYYRTPVSFDDVRNIGVALRHGVTGGMSVPALSLFRHLHDQASPGRTPSDGPFQVNRTRASDAPYVVDVLTVEHKHRMVYYLTVFPTHRSAVGGYSLGFAPGWGNERRLVAGHGATVVDAYNTSAFYTTNMTGRSKSPRYSLPHVLAATSMPVNVMRALTVTGEYGGATSDVDGFVPDGFTKVAWDDAAWSYPVSIAGVDLDDDLNSNVVGSLCSHVVVAGGDERVVRVTDFR